MVTQEEFEVLLEAFEEWLRQHPFEKGRVIMFKGNPIALWQLLNEMKMRSSLGYEFAEYLKAYGVPLRSDIFESIAEEIRRLSDKMLIATWTLPSGKIITMEELANEVEKRTDFGKSYVKNYLTTVIERVVKYG
jgi:hypothetical protein